MKAADLRVKTISQLKDDLKLFQREKMNLRFQKASKEAVNIVRIKLVRKAIARIKTVMDELKYRGNNA